MNRVLYLLLCLYCCLTAYANDSIPSAAEYTGNVWTDHDIDIPESLNTDLDSLLQDWHIKTYRRVSKECDCDSTIPSFSDSVLMARLGSIPTVIPMTFNPVIRRCIDLYSNEKREQVQVMLGLGDYYFPYFEQALEKYQLPLELKYLSVVESALNPNAVSRVGAAGLWQFMYGTGIIYGLEINTLVDERRDPIKSSDAAARYLKDLYGIFGDWQLAIAAYNCGPGNVNKAIRRAGKRNYWDIYYYLPRETRAYVPLFIAANYIMHFYKEHELCPIKTSLATVTDTMWIYNKIHFDQIASVIGIPKETLKSMNPQYRCEIIPGSSDNPHILCLPAKYTMAYIDYQDSIPKYEADVLLNEDALTAKPADPPVVHVQAAQPQYHSYRVRRGDTLQAIANRHRVSVAKLKRWNSIHSSRLQPGMRLKIY
ncbi:MAG: transglycosylase SLT domain-containing protein [Bacteroidota bacterium]|nr:transglycosylase SLT domain-containing protein [Bacteroidota bacterium]